MNRITPLVTLALVCAACSSTSGGRYGASQEFNANCRVKDQEISIEVETNGKPISELELVMQDGSVVHPEFVRGPRGKEVAMGIVPDSPSAAVTLDTHKQPERLFVSFPKGNGTNGPRQLVLRPENGESSSILLAKVDGQKIDSRYSVFGYSCELRTFPDEAQEVIYVRTDANGNRHEISRSDFESGIAQSINRVYEDLPGTAGEIADTPGVTQFLANIFEQGYRYGGNLAGAETPSQSQANEFWSNPVRVVSYDSKGREQKNEDPLSTITRLLVAAVNAANSDELRALHDSVRNGECDESQFIRAEAAHKARGLKLAMDILRENSDTLAVGTWKSKKYGHYYSLYMGWLQDAESDSESEEATISRLTNIILQSLTRKGIGRGEKPISYHLKLQRQFDELISEFTE